MDISSGLRRHCRRERGAFKEMMEEATEGKETGGKTDFCNFSFSSLSRTFHRRLCLSPLQERRKPQTTSSLERKAMPSSFAFFVLSPLPNSSRLTRPFLAFVKLGRWFRKEFALLLRKNKSNERPLIHTVLRLSPLHSVLVRSLALVLDEIEPRRRLQVARQLKAGSVEPVRTRRSAQTKKRKGKGTGERRT
jgi:hypothetical protein